VKRLLLVIAALVVIGCKADTEYAGLGPWIIKTTPLSKATGRCMPEALALFGDRPGTYCTLQPPLKIAGRPAAVDLYFDGVAPSSTLIEVRLLIRGCKEEDTLSFFRAAFGAPVATQGAKVFHQNGQVFVSVAAPSEPGQCTVRLVPTSESAAIEKLKAP
jgi:hypothetical protein